MTSLEYLKLTLGIALDRPATATFESATFTAVTPGVIGNSITLAIAIGDTPQQVIDAWNLIPANVNNQVSVIGGPATFVGASPTLALTGGVDEDHSRDAELQAYLDLAIGYIDDYMNRQMLAGDHLDIIQEPKQFSSIITKNWPINSVAYIASKGVMQTLTDYKIYNSLGKIILFTPEYIQMPIDGTFVEVQYNAGYAPGTEPAWLIQAIAMTAASIYGSKGGGGSVTAGTIKSESITGVYSVSYFSPNEQTQTASVSVGFGIIPDSVTAVLDAHKNRLI